MQAMPFSAKMDSTGQDKALNIFIKDGVVTNYTFTEGSTPTINVK